MTGYKSPPRKPSEIRVQLRYATLKTLAAKYRAGMPWKSIGAEIGVSGPTVRRAVALGIEPQDNKIRTALGLPVLGLGEECPIHHKVCAVKHKAAPVSRKPRRTRKARNLLNMKHGRWLVTSFDAWRARNAARLLALVAWAERRG